ncbi:MAG: class I SAM-dependent methyltransferase [Chloroflexi bacterium]|nr:class I SAM-dependent methyltransferase [Chloroflexota bacterium]
MTNQNCDNEKEKGCQNCGLFDFMSHDVGIKVLHPGGYKSTAKLSSMGDLNENSHVLDLACGTGTSAFFISDRYGCQVTGIDISKDLIAVANEDLEKRGDQGKLRFQVADALEIPFPDNSFDAVISQAFFILVDEKERALEEIVRVLKPGGFFGSLELSWFKTPPASVYEELIEKTCDFVPRVSTFGEWDGFFRSKSLTQKAVLQYPMEGGISKLLKSEGVANFVSIMLKMLGNSQTRTRMMTVQNTFQKHSDYLGYGIFGYQKPILP